MSRGVLLLAHGTVESLDELPEFLTTIRRGNPAPPELVAELRHRYEAIGGKSPLNDINRRIAIKLEAKLGVPVRLANRLARPYANEVIAEMASEGIDTLGVVPLAQYSAHVYEEAARKAASEVAPSMRVPTARRSVRQRLQRGGEDVGEAGTRQRLAGTRQRLAASVRELLDDTGRVAADAQPGTTIAAPGAGVEPPHPS